MGKCKIFSVYVNDNVFYRCATMEEAKSKVMNVLVKHVGRIVQDCSNAENPFWVLATPGRSPIYRIVSIVPA